MSRGRFPGWATGVVLLAACTGRAPSSLPPQSALQVLVVRCAACHSRPDPIAGYDVAEAASGQARAALRAFLASDARLLAHPVPLTIEQWGALAAWAND